MEGKKEEALPQRTGNCHYLIKDFFCVCVYSGSMFLELASGVNKRLKRWLRGEERLVLLVFFPPTPTWQLTSTCNSSPREPTGAAHTRCTRIARTYLQA